jgi:DNA primase
LPFHNENAFLTVSPAKEIYNALAVAGVKSIGFLMEHEKYSYVEAFAGWHRNTMYC